MTASRWIALFCTFRVHQNCVLSSASIPLQQIERFLRLFNFSISIIKTQKQFVLTVITLAIASVSQIRFKFILNGRL